MSTTTASDLRLDAEPGHRPGTREYRRVVIGLFLAGLATFVLLYSTQAILPQLSAAFDVSTAASTWSVSLTTLTLCLALLVAGPLSDAVGRTHLIHASLIASAVVAAACAFAPNWTTLLVLRALLGLTVAGLPAVATAYLREELHASAHARAAGLYIGGTALGGMSGRLLTGGVADLLDWRWALASAAVVSAGCAVGVRLLLPASRHFEGAPLRLGSTLRRGRAALSDPGLLALYGVGACGMGAMAGVFNTLGFRLQGAPFGLGVGLASLVFLTYPVGSVSSTLAGRWADTHGRRPVLPAGAALAAVGLLLTAVGSLPVLVVGLALFVAGFFAMHGVASGWVPVRAHAGGNSTAQAASLYLCAYYLGSSVFGTLAGQTWSSHGWTGVETLTVALLALCAVLGLALRRVPSLLPAR